MNKRTLFHIFSTPVTIQGWAWLPFSWGLAWGLLAWLAGRKHPEYGPGKRAAAGAAQTAVMLGSEWAHNCAHAAAAHAVGKPMDELKILGGMPLCVYNDVNDQRVTPQEHILRAMGGPLFNLGLMFDLRLLRRGLTALGLARPNSFLRDVLDMAVGMNTFLATVSYTPIPELDGGPIVKWTLVQRGRSVAEADALLEKLNGWLAGPFALAGLWLLRRGQRYGLAWWLGGVFLQFGFLMALIGLGWLKEEQYTQVRGSI